MATPVGATVANTERSDMRPEIGPLDNARSEPQASLSSARDIAVFAGLVAVVILGLMAFFTLEDRAERLTEAYRAIDQLAETLEAHTGRTLQSNHITLDRLVDLSRRQAPYMRQTGLDTASHEALRGMLERAPDVGVAALLDRSGRAETGLLRNANGGIAALPSDLDFADQDFFNIHRIDEKRGLFVGDPIPMGAGRLFVPLSRRIGGPDAPFAGVAMTMIDSGSFNALYDSLCERGDLRVELIRTDGTILAHCPKAPGTVPGTRFGTNMDLLDRVVGRTSGRFELRGPYGTMITAFRQVRDFPMAVAVSMPRRVALSTWRESAIRQGAAAGLMIALVALLAGLLTREVRRRERSVRDALTHSQERFRTVFDHAGIGIVLCNGNGEIETANRAFADMLGIEIDTLHRAGWSALAEPPPPDHILFNGARLIEPVSEERRLIVADGREIWVRMTCSRAHRATGDPMIIAMTENVTAPRRMLKALKESEARYQRTADAGRVGVWDLDPHSGSLYLAKNLKGLLGYNDWTLEDRLDAWLEKVHPGDLADIETLLQRAEPGVLELEHRMIDAAGATRWMHLRGEATAHGGQRRLFGTYTEITKRKLTEIALKDSQTHLKSAKDEAERASAGKTRFLAAVSHDLRQPSQALALFMGLLKDRNRDPDLGELIASMNGCLDGLHDMLSVLSDVSKLDAARIVPNRKPVALGPLMAQLIAELAPSANRKGLRLKLFTRDLTIDTDPVLLARILRNLLTNAIRYTETGGVMLGVRLRGGLARIEVWDTGPGIAEADREAIFQEFHQIGNAARDRREGLGLGLAIVRRLAALLHHPLDLRSRQGRGSVFSVAAPVTTAAEPGLQEIGTAIQPASGDLERGRAILVIEDDPDIRSALALQLAEWGYRPQSAADRAEAKALLTGDFRPEILLADFRLPDGTGVQAVAEIREILGQDVPALLVSGETDPAKLTDARKAGLELLHKPVKPVALRRKLGRLLALAAMDPAE